MKFVLLTMWSDRQGETHTSFETFDIMGKAMERYNGYVEASKQSSRKMIEAVILQGIDPSYVSDRVTETYTPGGVCSIPANMLRPVSPPRPKS